MNILEKAYGLLGFISTTAKGEIAERNSSNGPMVSVFVPTTPNPTSGFLLFFPKADIIELDMSIEDAAKLVISAGLVYPPTKKHLQKLPLKKSPSQQKSLTFIDSASIFNPLQNKKKRLQKQALSH